MPSMIFRFCYLWTTIVIDMNDISISHDNDIEIIATVCNFDMMTLLCGVGHITSFKFSI